MFVCVLGTQWDVRESGEVFVCVLGVQWDVRESGEVSVCMCVRYTVGCEGVRRG